MRKIKIQDAEIMQIAIQQEISRSDESRYDHRLHGVLLICAGFSASKVAKLFNRSARTIQYWAHRFEAHGFDGLRDTEKPGRPGKITDDIRQVIDGDLRKNPRELGYSQNLWDGKLLSHHLIKSKRLRLGVRQCQRLFHKLGFRRRKPRPIIASADPVAQAQYKKTSTHGKES